MLTIRDFYNIGKEHKYDPGISTPVKLFTSLFGQINIHPRIRAGHILREIQNLPLANNARILDAGCGRAAALFWLAIHNPSYTLHGIEINQVTIKRNHHITQVMDLRSLSFERGDLSNIEIQHENYDLIISMDVLEHIENDLAVLKTLHYALKPTGFLLLHLPLRHQKQLRIFKAFHAHTVHDHVRDEYLPDEIEKKLAFAGFQVLHLRYGFGWHGELAFELNNLFWHSNFLRAITALLTYPLSLYLAYKDINSDLVQGNSMIILAKKKAHF